jgi:alpha-D-ribose 1-methylphosphonate 5-triphosphate synthase subunit PhnI
LVRTFNIPAKQNDPANQKGIDQVFQLLIQYGAVKADHQPLSDHPFSHMTRDPPRYLIR